MSLQSSLQADMLTPLQKFDDSVTTLENWISHVETNMGAIASTVNDLVNAIGDYIEENQWIKDKQADLEDGSLLNN